MKINDFKYNSFIEILKEELVPAMGCTEPIAIAYCAAVVRDYLGIIPEKVDIYVSGNILKNVKSVVVPNTSGLRGISSSVAIGIIGGIKELKLECLSKVNDEDREKKIKGWNKAVKYAYGWAKDE